MGKNEKKGFLDSLGISGLESEVYLFLLKNPPATGYKIAKEIGKHKTNVYIALGSLVEKGALLLDDGENLVYRAIMPNELLNQAENKLKDLRGQAEQLTLEFKDQKPDGKIYKLKSTNQVYEKSIKILKESKKIVLIELFPVPFSKLFQEILKTANRGVNLIVRVYTEKDYQKINKIKGIRAILSPFGENTLNEWKLQWLAIFSDGIKHIIAFMNTIENSIVHAVWSENNLLSWAFFSYIHVDLLYYSIRPLIFEAGSLDELKRKVKRLEGKFPFDEVPGFDLLDIKYNQDFSGTGEKNEI